jgi:hypothetical protein
MGNVGIADTGSPFSNLNPAHRVASFARRFHGWIVRALHLTLRSSGELESPHVLFRSSHPNGFSPSAGLFGQT